MLLWCDLPRKRRIRIWTFFHYHRECNALKSVLGLEINRDNYYGLIIFGLYLGLYLKAKIDEKKNIIPYAWHGKQQSRIGFLKKD